MHERKCSSCLCILRSRHTNKHFIYTIFSYAFPSLTLASVQSEYGTSVTLYARNSDWGALSFSRHETKNLNAINAHNNCVFIHFIHECWSGRAMQVDKRPKKIPNNVCVRTYCTALVQTFMIWYIIQMRTNNATVT